MKIQKRCRKNRIKKRNIIVITTLSLIFLIQIGYSAFSTNLSLKAKGNINILNASKYLKTKIITEGDGLYKDYTENNRYIFRGKSPNNYITFNNELWHIIAIEPDNTLKIVKDSSIGNMQFDSDTNRNNTNNTYCNRENTYSNVTKYYGCGVWSATPVEYNDGIYSGTVTQDSTLNIYLNTEYYNSLNEDIKYITAHNFNIGITKKNNEDTAVELYNDEKKQTWYGKIGLINSSDYMKASTNSNCDTYNNSRKYPSPCSYENGNYLDKIKAEFWTIDRQANTTAQGNTAGYIGQGGLSGWYATHRYQILPVVYLKKDIVIIGNGDIKNPYQIKNY